MEVQERELTETVNVIGLDPRSLTEEAVAGLRKGAQASKARPGTRPTVMSLPPCACTTSRCSRACSPMLGSLMADLRRGDSPVPGLPAVRVGE